MRITITTNQGIIVDVFDSIDEWDDLYLPDGVTWASVKSLGPMLTDAILTTIREAEKQETAD